MKTPVKITILLMIQYIIIFVLNLINPWANTTAIYFGSDLVLSSEKIASLSNLFILLLPLVSILISYLANKYFIKLSTKTFVWTQLALFLILAGFVVYSFMTTPWFTIL